MNFRRNAPIICHIVKIDFSSTEWSCFRLVAPHRDGFIYNNKKKQLNAHGNVHQISRNNLVVEYSNICKICKDAERHQFLCHLVFKQMWGIDEKKNCGTSEVGLQPLSCIILQQSRFLSHTWSRVSPCQPATGGLLCKYKINQQYKLNYWPVGNLTRFIKRDSDDVQNTGYEFDGQIKYPYSKTCECTQHVNLQKSPIELAKNNKLWIFNKVWIFM